MFKLKLQQKKRDILHIDADAFFASVEQILNPRLKGKPVLVGSDSGNKGIVSAASYEARAFGVHSAMPMYLARKKCPKAIVVTGNFEAYREFSEKMYEIFYRYTPEIEMASIDEAYLDITGYPENFGETAEIFAKMILLEVNKKLGLSVSGGLASGKTVAKVASSTNKPHKLTIVPYGKEANFLAPLELRSLPGIGPSTLDVLEKCDFHTIGDVAKLDVDDVVEKFGIQGIPLWKRANGIDNSEVISTESLPKSISKEHTFYKAPLNESEAINHLKELATKVFSKLRSNELKAKTIFIKIRYRENDGAKRIFRDVAFQQNLEFPSCTDKAIFPIVKKLFLANLVSVDALRLIGVGVTKLCQNYNLNLFGEEVDEKLFFKMDMIKNLYGDKALKYGA